MSAWDKFLAAGLAVLSDEELFDLEFPWSGALEDYLDDEMWRRFGKPCEGMRWPTRIWDVHDELEGKLVWTVCPDAKAADDPRHVPKRVVVFPEWCPRCGPEWIECSCGLGRRRVLLKPLVAS